MTTVIGFQNQNKDVKKGLIIPVYPPGHRLLGTSFRVPEKRDRPCELLFGDLQVSRSNESFLRIDCGA